MSKSAPVDRFKNTESLDEVMSAWSTPEYPHRYGGPCIIAGSAWCVDEDIRKARELRPNAPIIAVNRSPLQSPVIRELGFLFMVALDFKKAQAWKTESEKIYGPVELHAGKPLGPGWPMGHKYINYWWPRLQGGGGTSAWFGSKLAINRGFEEVIVCGAPLEPGPYADGSTGWSDRDMKQMESYRKAWVRETYLHPFIRGMSGFPKELLGAPK